MKAIDYDWATFIAVYDSYLTPQSHSIRVGDKER